MAIIFIWVLVLTYPGPSGVSRTMVEYQSQADCFAGQRWFKQDNHIHVSLCWKMTKRDRFTEESA